MNLILDTHIFIWFINGDNNLTAKSRKEIENPANVKFISIASIWEMAIKVSLKRLDINRPFEDILEQIDDNGFEILPILFEHTLKLTKLDLHHRDPFDRLIIAQSLVEKMPVISKDKFFDAYKVRRIW